MIRAQILQHHLGHAAQWARTIVGHNELAAEAVEAAGEEFEVIPLTSGDDCDRLFIAPREERSFARSD